MFKALFISLSAHLFFLFGFLVPTFAQEKESFGWVEKVRLLPENIIIHAKLDTGADGSSLDATDLVEFKKDGEDWVRFQLRNRYGKKITIEKPIRRTALIKRHRAKHQKRKVIRIGVCLGKTYMEEDMSLIDRTNFEYQMLLGRRFLAGNAVVDSAVAYTRDPNCKKGGESKQTQ